MRFFHMPQKGSSYSPPYHSHPTGTIHVNYLHHGFCEVLGGAQKDHVHETMLQRNPYPFLASHEHLNTSSRECCCRRHFNRNDALSKELTAGRWSLGYGGVDGYASRRLELSGTQQRMELGGFRQVM